MGVSWRLLTAAVLLVAVAACGDDDAADPLPAVAATTAVPAAPSSAATTSQPASAASVTTEAAPTTTGVVPTGFGTVAARVTAADGSTCDVCLWAASTAAEQTRGLMGVTDLGGADGMVFHFASPVATQFWMRDTVMPLSIAFYAADGSFVSSADMTPCLQPTPDAECARYGAAGPYQYAVEVAAGGLEPLLMGPGSRLELLAGECPRSP